MRNAAASLFLCILLLLPVAWLITHGLVSQEFSVIFIRVIMTVSSFLIGKTVFSIREKKSFRGILFYTLTLYAGLLLFTAGMKDMIFSPTKPIPSAVCGLIGYAAAVIKNGKSNSHKKKRRKKYNK